VWSGCVVCEILLYTLHLYTSTPVTEEPGPLMQMDVKYTL